MNEEKSPRAEVGPGQGQIVKILYEDRHRALRERHYATHDAVGVWRLSEFDRRTGPLVDEVVAAARAVTEDFDAPQERYDEHYRAWRMHFPDGAPTEEADEEWQANCPCDWCRHERNLRRSLAALDEEAAR